MARLRDDREEAPIDGLDARLEDLVGFRRGAAEQVRLT
jgi:hypothetical protein